MGQLEADALDARLAGWIGRSLSATGPSRAPDPVNLPMIRHWVDALDDRNPVYLDGDVASRSRFGGIVAPPAMLQTWTMARPRIEGIAERGGSAGAIDPDHPIQLLSAAGYTGTLATNSELRFDRYLRLGDQLQSDVVLESISERKATGLGQGYFVTWVSTWLDASGEKVGSQRFRILKFDPSTFGQRPPRPAGASAAPAQAPAEPTGEELPDFELPVTATVIVAGAIASRDFMPVHHDRDYAQAQGAPDIFMNILTTNGYMARYVTDWAGPEARLESIDVRLGAPAVPGKPLRFSGRVEASRLEGEERLLELAVRVANDLGDHATGRVVVGLPR